MWPFLGNAPRHARRWNMVVSCVGLLWREYWQFSSHAVMCDRRSECTGRKTPLLVEAGEPPPTFWTLSLREGKNVGHRPRRDLKPRMTVLAKVSVSLTERESHGTKNQGHCYVEIPQQSSSQLSQSWTVYLVAAAKKRLLTNKKVYVRFSCNVS
jgi:hypothetical protein